MLNESYLIREAQRSEIPKLAELGKRLFVQTFEGLYSHENMADFLNKVHSPARVTADWDSGCVFWMAASVGQGGSSDEWVGYCKAGPLKVPVETGDRSTLELRQIYIDRDHHRQGIGARFMQLFLELCHTRQIQDAYVSCWTENQNALAFYSRHGFEVVGTYDFMIGQHRDRDHILRRTLS